MKIKLMFVVAALAFAVLAAGRIAVPHANAATGYERLQTLIDGHMSSEAALAAAERAAVASVRADLRQDEMRQRASVRRIRRDYRIKSATMTTRHASEKETLDAELL